MLMDIFWVDVEKYLDSELVMLIYVDICCGDGLMLLVSWGNTM